MNLDACYFCGTVDDLDRYAVVPGRFDPTPDEQRAVVLCPTCFRKLRTVIEPLANRLDQRGRRASESAEDGAASTSAAAPSTGASNGATDTDRSEDESTDDEPTDADEADAAPPGRGVSNERAAAREAMSLEAGDTPEGYARLMRLLENRTFPMRRGEINELASGAYGMDPEDVEASLDAAVEAGRFQPDAEEPELLYRA